MNNLLDIRKNFTLLSEKVNDKDLVYLDNAATTLTPNQVIERIADYYQKENANIHRGVHYLAEKATQSYEETRSLVQDFIGAKSQKEIIFTSGTTASINLVAYSYGLNFLQAEDEIILSAMEHHSNIIPWQLIAKKTGAILKIIPINQEGEIILEEFEKLLTPKTKLVSLVYVSNALGTINPVKKIIELSHKKNALVLLDGAQTVSHLPIDVKELDVDFFVFSGHKLFGPTGVGILYGKEVILEKMPPFLGGGEMIRKVGFSESTFKEPPYKFEAGTPPIAEVIGLGAAIKWFRQFDLKEIQKWENHLLIKAEAELQKIPEVRLIGTAKQKAAIASFTLQNIHPHDIGSLLDEEGIAVRTGHHCTQPVMNFFQVAATTRASFSFYNNEEDVEKLIMGIKKVVNFFK